MEVLSTTHNTPPLSRYPAEKPSVEPREFWVVGLYNSHTSFSLLEEAWEVVRASKVKQAKPGVRLFTFVLDKGDVSPLNLESHRWDFLNIRKLDFDQWEWMIWLGRWMYGSPGPDPDDDGNDDDGGDDDDDDDDERLCQQYRQRQEPCEISEAFNFSAVDCVNSRYYQYQCQLDDSGFDSGFEDGDSPTDIQNCWGSRER